MLAHRYVAPSCLLQTISVVALACGAGCASEKPDAQAQRPPKPREMKWDEEQIRGAGAAIAQPVAVKQGALPLAYLADVGTTVRVVDETGRGVVAEATLPARSIVSVSEKNGVVASGRTIVAGPLQADHRYGIYVVPSAESVSRFGRYEEIASPAAQQQNRDPLLSEPASQEQNAAQQPVEVGR
jgi:hypothetical protein